MIVSKLKVLQAIYSIVGVWSERVADSLSLIRNCCSTVVVQCLVVALIGVVQMHQNVVVAQTPHPNKSH